MRKARNPETDAMTHPRMTRTAAAAAVPAAAALLLAAALPAQAQEAVAVGPDLRCAAWALAASSQAEDEAQRRGLSLVMAWFLGRHEATGGSGDMEAALAPDALGKTIGTVAEANALCQPQAQKFGQRLNAVGSKLQAAARPAQPKAEEGR